MFQINLACRLWDLVDEGIDTVLDRLKGEAGVTGINVPLVTGLMEQFRVHAVEPRVFRSAGGVNFQPQAGLYTATRIRPVTAAWLKKSNPLRAVVEGCARRGLTLAATMDCCFSPITVERFASAACKSVFGGQSPGWLCPSNLDVREYLRSLAQDAASTYQPSELTCEALSYPMPVVLEDEEIDLGGAGWWLAEMCFCESCRQAAGRDGVDVEAAARSVRVRLEKVMNAGEPFDGADLKWLAADVPLADYVQWQGGQLELMVTAMKTAVGEHCKLKLETFDPTPVEAADGLVSDTTPDLETLESVVRGATELAGEPSRVELRIAAGWRDCPEAATLVRAVARAAELGLRTVTIQHYGALPLKRLDWVRQAARKAQRDAS